MGDGHAHDWTIPLLLMLSKLDNMWHAPESKVLDNQRMLLLSPGTVGRGPSTKREGLFRRCKAGPATHTGDWQLLPGCSNQVRCLPHLGVILRIGMGEGQGTFSDPRNTATAGTHKHCVGAQHRAKTGPAHS
ncbi:unnamed protein product [Symbiodinium natans]|uniref:Uncharacterized protein n=1 Tax=Symbiodinium natans TaxID=878477 RepID=A0A812KR63_9DINO|nr:unnamed protein product [Symbiodinium natans]